MKFTTIFAAVGLGQIVAVLAHGPPDSLETIQKRDQIRGEQAKVFERNCAATLRKRANFEKRASKTEAFVNSYLEGRGLEPTFQSKDDSTATCVLTPEQEVGPYYVPGQMIRNDNRESEAGIDFLIELQLLNVHTCRPLRNVLVDFWACNSTGVYSGISNQNTVGETFLRALAKSDEDGVVHLLTKFPGWYPLRTQHIHVEAHVNYTIANHTVVGGSVVHIGQLLFDQDFLTKINKYTPYVTNTGLFTPNKYDNIFVNQANKTVGYKATMDIRQVGADLSNGILGRQVMAIDPETIPAAVGGNHPTSFPSGPIPSGFVPFPTSA